MGPALRLRLSLSRPFLRAGGGLRPRVRGSPTRIRVGAQLRRQTAGNRAAPTRIRVGAQPSPNPPAGAGVRKPGFPVYS